MDLEIDLPPGPTSQSHFPSEISTVNHKRKRPRLEYDVTSSSDPALFSSDDHDPTAEDYVSKRRKQKWRGTWWGEKYKSGASQASVGGKRTFTRNFDSGVWMGSDETDASLENEFLEDSVSAGRGTSALTFPLNRIQRGIITVGKDPIVSSNNDQVDIHQHSTCTLASEEARILSLHKAVDSIIDHCLEAGDENVDLSSMALENVSNVSLRRLRSLTKHGTIQELPPSQDAYLSIEPALRLYLSNNLIRLFPSEILNLTNLRVLSLRHNKLTKIPPALAKLNNLEHLNVAGNKLRHLAYDLLCLYDRAGFRMIVTPNPLEQFQSQQLSSQIQIENSTGFQPFQIAKSSASYFQGDGTRVHTAVSRNLTRVPSLVELALQKCQNLPDFEEIKDWCAVGEGPASLSVPMAMAQAANEYGHLDCPSCGRAFIVPRGEWIEWWKLPFNTADHLEKGTFHSPAVPFLRQACSWACVEELTSS